jgi:hypothetical protein
MLGPAVVKSVREMFEARNILSFVQKPDTTMLANFLKVLFAIA